GVRQLKQHVAVLLHLLAAFAQLLFRPLESLIRPHEFDRALGNSFLQRRIELANFALCPLVFGYVAGDDKKQGTLTERDRRHHNVERQLASIIAARQPLKAMTALVQRKFCHLPGLLNGEPAVRLALWPDLRW